MWREDLTVGLLSVEELKEGFDNHPYAIRLVDSIFGGVTKGYRAGILNKYNNGATALALSNFI